MSAPARETREEWLSMVNGLDPKASGGWVRFHCPVPNHGKGQGDQDRSAGVGREGPYIKCFGGCTLKDLANALRGRNGNKSAVGTPSRAAPAQQKPDNWIEVESYEYRDINGKLIAVKRRREQPDAAKKKGYDKDFGWRLPESKAYDGFKGKITQADVPLWGSELLKDAPLTQRVWFTEGEKACKAVRGAGELAVCAGGGAAQVEFGDALQVLQGRPVIIWPDNDKSGKDFARMLRKALRGIAKSVVQVDAPVGETEDAHEYLVRDKGTIEALLEGKLTAPTCDIHSYNHFTVRIPVDGSIVAFDFREVRALRIRNENALQTDMTVEVYGPGMETEPYNQEINLKSQSTRDGLRRALELQFGKEGLNWTTLISIGYARLNRAFEDTDHMVQLMDLPAVSSSAFIVDTFVPQLVPTLVFGKGGSLKTWIIAWWALHLALGEELEGGYGVKPCNVAILDYEDPAAWQERMRRLLAGMGLGGYDPDAFLRQLPIKFWKGDRGMSLESIRVPLRRSLQRHDIDVLIVDSAMPACGGKPEDSDTTIAFWNAIHSLDVTSIVISHVSAAEMEKGTTRPYGNVLWENQPRRIWAIIRDDDEDKDDIPVMARCTKVNRGKKPRPQGLMFHFDGDDGPVTVEPYTEFRKVESFAKNLGPIDQIRAALQREGSAMTLSEICGALDVPPTQQGKIRAQLKRMPDIINLPAATGRGNKARFGLLAPGEARPEQKGF